MNHAIRERVNTDGGGGGEGTWRAYPCSSVSICGFFLKEAYK